MLRETMLVMTMRSSFVFRVASSSEPSHRFLSNFGSNSHRCDTLGLVNFLNSGFSPEQALDASKNG